ncbi:MAG: disulfide bond formation protein B [Alphaproteobacteria bacterium]|nr:disulfide bond formation protein B [Alphaproteobacteria bacterium]
MKKKKIWSGTHREIRSLRTASWLALVSAILVLCAVFVAQYGLGYLPCKFCIWQRWPWAGVAVLGLLSWLLVRYSLLRWSRLVIYGMVSLLLVGAGIAFYHMGIEFHWWTGPITCTGTGVTANATDLESLRRALTGAPVVFCDQPAWQFHGLTMAGLNLLLSLGLLGLLVFLLL